MKLPFHGVHVSGGVIFAARGGNIHSFSTDGAHISCWKYPVEATDQKSEQHAQPAPTPPTHDRDDDDGPPAKRVRLDDDGEAEEEPIMSDLDVAQGKKGEAKGKQQGKRQGRKEHGRSNIPQHPERPMVTIMDSTKGDTACHLVAVTSDKSIWVFEHDGRGGLKQLSRRTMPKRPCSIVLTPDNQEILSADKFGDVYSLPLLPSEEPPANTTAAPRVPAPAPTPFTPQATELTVHSARNRRALKDQLASRANPKAWGGGGGGAPPPAPPFACHLLLGHVSLLTAIALGRDGGARPYILTADRDEHIRVSRGTRAQAHVIERYCLGHAAFVRRLLVGPRRRAAAAALLLSGGGDPEVLVWRWRAGALVGRADVLGRVRAVVPGADKIALTGLSYWEEEEEEEEEEGGGGAGTRIVVFCERVPAIFLFTLHDSGALDYSSTITLPGNPFEVGVVDATALIVAIDPNHKEAGGEYDVKKSLLKIEHAGGEYRVLEDVIKDVGNEGGDVLFGEDVSVEEFDRMLYSAETLRKVYYEKTEAEETKGGPNITDEPEVENDVDMEDEPEMKNDLHSKKEPEMENEPGV